MFENEEKGTITAKTVSKEFGIDEARAEEVLEELATEGVLQWDTTENAYVLHYDVLNATSFLAEYRDGGA